MSIRVRNTEAGDIPGIISLCKAVYPESPPWTQGQIESHLSIYPQGQFVAIKEDTQTVVGMSASLIIRWDDYDFKDSWKEFTDSGLFTNHDPENGRTLYAAEVMVHPLEQGLGIGSKLYAARENLARTSKLLRIRAGARLRGYGAHSKTISPDDYAIEVIKGNMFDPTLTFQLKRGFRVLHVVSGYLKFDTESLGYAAVIEWLNEDVASPTDYSKGNVKFQIKGKW